MNTAPSFSPWDLGRLVYNEYPVWESVPPLSAKYTPATPQTFQSICRRVEGWTAPQRDVVSSGASAVDLTLHTRLEGT